MFCRMGWAGSLHAASLGWRAGLRRIRNLRNVCRSRLAEIPRNCRAPTVNTNHTTAGLKIAVDTWVLGGQSRNHGVHQYTAQLLCHFRELATSHDGYIQPYISADVATHTNQLTP